MEAATINEEHVFPSLVRSATKSRETVAKSVQYFLQMIPYNIFENQWYILYEIISNTARHDQYPTMPQANQIILNSLNNLMNNEAVKMKELVDTPHDTNQAARELIALCSQTWQDMMETEIDESDFKANLQIFIDSWAQREYKKLHVTCHNIMTTGVRVRGKQLSGVDEMQKFYLAESARIENVRNANTRVVDPIRMGPDGFEAFQKTKENDPISQIVAHLGIKSIDELIGGIRKSDLMTIIAYSANGKTRMMGSVCYNASIKQRSNGRYYCLEGTPREYLCKIIARHLTEKYGDPPVDDDMILKGTYEPKYEDIVRTAEYDVFNNPNYGRIHFIPPELYMEDLRGGLETSWRQDGKFDYLVIDHTSLVKSRIHNTKKDMLDALYPDLKNIAGSFMGEGLAVMCCHQMNADVYEQLLKAKEGEEPPTDLGTADSKEVMRSSNLSFTLLCTKEHKMNNKTDIFCTKMRNSQGFPKRTVFARLGNCLYADLPSASQNATFKL